MLTKKLIKLRKNKKLFLLLIRWGKMVNNFKMILVTEKVKYVNSQLQMIYQIKKRNLKKRKNKSQIFIKTQKNHKKMKLLNNKILNLHGVLGMFGIQQLQ